MCIGMLLADGCISTRNSSKLSLIDEQIINDIHQQFPFFQKRFFDFSKYNSNSKVQYSLSKRCKNLTDHLYSHGIRERKSTENAHQLTLPKIDSKLMHHVLRGYFDGNGSINIPHQRPNLRRAEFCSSSKTLIEDIKNTLENLGIKVPIYRVKNNNNSVLYVLEWVKTEDVLALGEFLYKDASLKLERKHSLFDFRLIQRTENNPTCEICSTNLIKNGFRETKKLGKVCRFYCGICNKHSQIPLAQLKEDELLEHPKD